jgi:hypothetical protein
MPSPAQENSRNPTDRSNGSNQSQPRRPHFLFPQTERRARRRLVPAPPPHPAEDSSPGPIRGERGPSPSLHSTAAARDSGPDCRELAGVPLFAVCRRRCWYGSSLLDLGDRCLLSSGGISGVFLCDGGVGFRVLIGGRTRPIAVEPNLGCWGIFSWWWTKLNRSKLVHGGSSAARANPLCGLGLTRTVVIFCQLLAASARSRSFSCPPRVFS